MTISWLTKHELNFLSFLFFFARGDQRFERNGGVVFYLLIYGCLCMETSQEESRVNSKKSELWVTRGNIVPSGEQVIFIRRNLVLVMRIARQGPEGSYSLYGANRWCLYTLLWEGGVAKRHVLISFMASISNLQTTSCVDFSYSLVLVKLLNNSPSLKRENNDCNDVPPSLV